MNRTGNSDPTVSPSSKHLAVRHADGWSIVLCVLFVVLAVRGSAAWLGMDALQADPDSYQRLAINLARTGTYGFEDQAGHVVPTAYRPPLYPWLLSWLVQGDRIAPAAIALLHLTLGVATVALTYHIANRLNVRPAWLPATAVAVDPLLVRQSQLAMTETLATLLAAAGWAAWLQWLAPHMRGHHAHQCAASIDTVVKGEEPAPPGDQENCPDRNVPAGVSVDLRVAHSSADRVPADHLPERSAPPTGPNLAPAAPAEQGRGGRARSPGSSVSGAAAVGLLFGLSILARPSGAPWSALCAMILLLCAVQNHWRWRRTLAVLGVFCAGVCVCVLPWTFRNYQAFGKPIWATTHGGYTLLLANNPSIYDHFRRNGPSRRWDAELFRRRWAERDRISIDPADERFWTSSGLTHPVTGDDSAPPATATARSHLDASASQHRNDHRTWELEDNRRAYRAALATIGRQPGMFVLSCLYRFGWLWAWWPAEASPAIAATIGIWYALWTLGAVAGLFCRRLRSNVCRWAPGLAIALTLSIVHAVFWSNMRMRAPAMPVVYLLATLGGSSLLHLLRPQIGGALKKIENIWNIWKLINQLRGNSRFTVR